jgi:HD superfamily phosphodiesterase
MTRFYHFTFLVLFIFITGCAQGDSNPLAKNGQQSWNTHEQFVHLDGEWNFYKNKLLTPYELSHLGNIQPEKKRVPEYWDNKTGYGTYELTLILKDDKVGQPLALTLPKIYTSYTLWIDGKRHIKSGKVATEKQHADPYGIPDVAYFVPKKKEVNLVLQVSNYHYRKAGISGHLYVGDVYVIQSKIKLQSILEWFSIGALFIIGFLQLNLYFYRRKEPIYVFFGLFCLLIAFRVLLKGKMDIFYLFPHFNWEVAIKLDYLILFTCVILFTQYMTLLYAKECNTTVKNIVIIISFICLPIIIFTDSLVFTHFIYVFELLLFIIIPYMITVIFRAIKQKRDGSIIIGLAFIALSSSVIIDILFNGRMVNTMIQSTSLGLVLFCTGQSYVLSMKYSKALAIEEKLVKEIEQSQREVIVTLGEIIENRSKETGNHVRRVAEYSYLLAVKYGLSTKEANFIKNASPMHDIGKVAIPDHILNKPGKLTYEEFEVIKTHTEIGYKMLQHSKRELIKLAATIAYTHHEKYNGKGYPRGLVGMEIPLSGRITAIADVFDALSNHRVYKEAWPIEKIISLFENERGKHFDPKLVDIFLTNIDEFVKINEMYKDR